MKYIQTLAAMSCLVSACIARPPPGTISVQLTTGTFNYAMRQSELAMGTITTSNMPVENTFITCQFKGSDNIGKPTVRPCTSPSNSVPLSAVIANKGVVSMNLAGMVDFDAGFHVIATVGMPTANVKDQLSADSQPLMVLP